MKRVNYIQFIYLFIKKCKSIYSPGPKSHLVAIVKHNFRGLATKRIPIGFSHVILINQRANGTKWELFHTFEQIQICVSKYIIQVQSWPDQLSASRTIID